MTVETILIIVFYNCFLMILKRFLTLKSSPERNFDSSHKFWDIFGFRKENRKKKLGYYEIENIDNPCLVTIALNLKEYLEVLNNLKLNKKHKGIKKGSTGMNFENFEKPPTEAKQVSKLTVDKGEMVKKTVKKTKFSQLNDKRFYF